MKNTDSKKRSKETKVVAKAELEKLHLEVSNYTAIYPECLPVCHLLEGLQAGISPVECLSIMNKLVEFGMEHLIYLEQITEWVDVIRLSNLCDLSSLSIDQIKEISGYDI